MNRFARRLRCRCARIAIATTTTMMSTHDDGDNEYRERTRTHSHSRAKIAHNLCICVCVCTVAHSHTHRRHNNTSFRRNTRTRTQKKRFVHACAAIALIWAACARLCTRSHDVCVCRVCTADVPHKTSKPQAHTHTCVAFVHASVYFYECVSVCVSHKTHCMVQ